MNEIAQIILSVVLVLVAIVLILVILLQSGKSDGLSGALSGAAESFFGKNKSRSVEAKLARMTAWCAGAFVLLTFILAIF